MHKQGKSFLRDRAQGSNAPDKFPQDVPYDYQHGIPGTTVGAGQQYRDTAAETMAGKKSGAVRPQGRKSFKVTGEK